MNPSKVPKGIYDLRCGKPRVNCPGRIRFNRRIDKQPGVCPRCGYTMWIVEAIAS